MYSQLEATETKDTLSVYKASGGKTKFRDMIRNAKGEPLNEGELVNMLYLLTKVN